MVSKKYLTGAMESQDGAELCPNGYIFLKHEIRGGVGCYYLEMYPYGKDKNKEISLQSKELSKDDIDRVVQELKNLAYPNTNGKSKIKATKFFARLFGVRSINIIKIKSTTNGYTEFIDINSDDVTIKSFTSYDYGIYKAMELVYQIYMISKFRKSIICAQIDEWLNSLELILKCNELEDLRDGKIKLKLNTYIDDKVVVYMDFSNDGIAVDLEDNKIKSKFLLDKMVQYLEKTTSRIY